MSSCENPIILEPSLVSPQEGASDQNSVLTHHEGGLFSKEELQAKVDAARKNWIDNLKQDMSGGGVYLIWCWITLKIYIGRAINFKKRMRGHQDSIRRLKENTRMVNALRKYGWNNFEVIILEKMDISNHQAMYDKETDYIKYFDATNRNIGYNINPDGKGSLGAKRSQEANRKTSESLKKYWKTHTSPALGTKWTEERRGEYSKRMKELRELNKNKKNPLLGRKISEQHRTRIKNWAENHENPFKNKKHSDETKAKWKLHRKNQHTSRKIAQIDRITNEIIKIWESISQASINLTGKLSAVPTISQTCNGYRKQAYNYKWIYLENLPLDYQI